MVDTEYTYGGPSLTSVVVPAADWCELKAALSTAETACAAAVKADTAKAAEIAGLRADLDLALGWLDAVTNGLSVQELAQLADVREEVAARWGLEGRAVQP